MSCCGSPLRNQSVAPPLLAWPGPELPQALSASAPAVAADKPRKFRRERENCPRSTLVSVVQRPRRRAPRRILRRCADSSCEILETLPRLCECEQHHVGGDRAAHATFRCKSCQRAVVLSLTMRQSESASGALPGQMFAVACPEPARNGAA